MKSLFLRVFLAALLLGGGTGSVFAGKNDAFAIPGRGANRNTDVFQIDHDNSKVEIQEYHLRLGTGSTPDVTPGADDMFIEGTLEVDGATRIDGTLTATGSQSIGDSSGDTLTIGAYTIHNASVTVNQAVAVGSATTLSGDITAGDSSGDTMTVGAYTIHNASITVNQGVTIGSTTALNGDTTIGNSQVDTVTFTAYAVHNSSITVNQGVTIGSATVVNALLTVNGNVASTGTLTIDQNVTLGNANTDIISMGGLLDLSVAADIDDAITATAAFQLIGNSNVEAEVCMSTGANNSSWVILRSTGAAPPCSN